MRSKGRRNAAPTSIMRKFEDHRLREVRSVHNIFKARDNGQQLCLLRIAERGLRTHAELALV